MTPYIMYDILNFETSFFRKLGEGIFISGREARMALSAYIKKPFFLLIYFMYS